MIFTYYHGRWCETTWTWAELLERIGDPGILLVRRVGR
jgi:hypothetical protein